MRLSQKQVDVIKQAAGKCIRYVGAKVFLFGSRADDSKKGGDIDLLFEIPGFSGDSLRMKLDFMTEYSKHLDEEKIDITIYDPTNPKDENKIFVNTIGKKILLWEENQKAGG
ncbi:MAG: nucleotidyltransferase domain-containing protein [Pseudomonadota bacterium]